MSDHSIAIYPRELKLMPNNLTLRQLRARARYRGVPNWQRMNKTQLNDALSKAVTVYASQPEFNVLYGAIQPGSELDN